MAEWSQAVGRGLTYIAALQRPDGGFEGLASHDPLRFVKPRVRPTIFFTALITECCAGIHGGEHITGRGTEYLLEHKSRDWSWNYWERGAAGKRMRGYPDDLDDTACALSAILAGRPELVDATVLGHVGQQLVACEQQPGGPYRTWLVPRAKLARWYDVDVAVNANIAHLLAGLQVAVPGLEDYLCNSVAGGLLVSSYYAGTYPTLYFLARVGWPRLRQALRRTITKELRAESAGRTALDTALLLAAASRVGYEQERLRPLAECLLAQQTGNNWPAGALYVEPPVGGVAYYAGSAALTTAFACEALDLYGRLAGTATVQTGDPYPATGPDPTIYDALKRYGRALPGAALRSDYLQAIERIRATDSDGQISNLVPQLAHDIGARVAADTIRHLQIASINGWIAYTLYDDALDITPGPVRISAANIALRQCERHFREALPASRQFAALVETTFMTVDAANAWEQHQARAQIRNGAIDIPRLPQYGRYDRLAQRSWGHVLATSGVLLAHGFDAKGVELRRWQRFFRHLIIARQLHDDAHDWQEDLAAGQLTAVVTRLLRTAGLAGRFTITDHEADLKQLFWEKVVLDICADITRHIGQADAAVGSCRFIAQPAPYRQLTTDLRRAVEATLAGRQQALEFMDAFTRAQ